MEELLLSCLCSCDWVTRSDIFFSLVAATWLFLPVPKLSFLPPPILKILFSAWYSSLFCFAGQIFSSVRFACPLVLSCSRLSARCVFPFGFASSRRSLVKSVFPEDFYLFFAVQFSTQD
jgi:hypothetical protein